MTAQHPSTVLRPGEDEGPGAYALPVCHYHQGPFDGTVHYDERGRNVCPPCAAGGGIETVACKECEIPLHPGDAQFPISETERLCQDCYSKLLMACRRSLAAHGAYAGGIILGSALRVGGAAFLTDVRLDLEEDGMWDGPSSE